MKRTISLILALIMIMAVAPLNTFAAESDKLVKNIEITIDTRIAGKTPSECADFLTVGGEGVKFDYSTFKALTYTDGPINGGFKEANVFEEGESYSSFLYIYPEEGYVLSHDTQHLNVKYTVIHEVGEFDGSFMVETDGDKTDGSSTRYKVLIHFTAEKQVPTGVAKIPYLIGKFFYAIANFFTKTFIQPIADLIMKLS